MFELIFTEHTNHSHQSTLAKKGSICEDTETGEKERRKRGRKKNKKNRDREREREKR